jgi:hypothetical protein
VSAAKGWTEVARIPQANGSTRVVYVESRNAREVREVLRQDPTRIDGLWCPTRVSEVQS